MEKKEVDPYVADYEYDKNLVLKGYQIDFIRYFYEFESIEDLELIKNEINEIISEVSNLDKIS